MWPKDCNSARALFQQPWFQNYNPMKHELIVSQTSNPKVACSILSTSRKCTWREWMNSTLFHLQNPRLMCPWARHPTAPRAPQQMAAHCSGCVSTVCMCSLLSAHCCVCALGYTSHHIHFQVMPWHINLLLVTYKYKIAETQNFFAWACISALPHSHAYEWKSMERRV